MPLLGDPDLAGGLLVPGAQVGGSELVIHLRGVTAWVECQPVQPVPNTELIVYKAS